MERNMVMKARRRKVCTLWRHNESCEPSFCVRVWKLWHWLRGKKYL